MADPDWHSLIRIPTLWGRALFLDLKLADTADTVREAVRRFADAGIAAVSTSTQRATEAAFLAADGIGVWQVLQLTDERSGRLLSPPTGHAVICPGRTAIEIRQELNPNIGIVVPGVRFAEDAKNGHFNHSAPTDIAGIATFAVVGRPIWQATDPVAAAIRYRDALAAA